MAADIPIANKVMIQVHVVVSEWERDQISARTRAALAAAKERAHGARRPVVADSATARAVSARAVPLREADRLELSATSAYRLQP
jgi:DNA invertase Pin-like site-specific DNA recombinase